MSKNKVRERIQLQLCNYPCVYINICTLMCIYSHSIRMFIYSYLNVSLRDDCMHKLWQSTASPISSTHSRLVITCRTAIRSIEECGYHIVRASLSLSLSHQLETPRALCSLLYIYIRVLYILNR